MHDIIRGPHCSDLLCDWVLLLSHRCTLLPSDTTSCHSGLDCIFLRWCMLAVLGFCQHQRHWRHQHAQDYGHPSDRRWEFYNIIFRLNIKSSELQLTSIPAVYSRADSWQGTKHQCQGGLQHKIACSHKRDLNWLKSSCISWMWFSFYLFILFIF